jgi:hypothetical protein
MKRLLFAAAAAVVLLPGWAAAQTYPSQFTSPVGRQPPNAQGSAVYSPYMNLALPGNVGLNYEGLVRPQIQQQQQIQQLQVGQQHLQGEQNALVAGLAAGGLGGYAPVTGHTTSFGNYLQFYPATVAGVGSRR